jgi:tetraacyldisaccharide 4'-kinase
MLRKLLFPFALLYGIGITIRALLFRLKILKSVRFDFPVISVGNLTTGGTGKTPHIEYLIQLLIKDYRLATLSRGYKRKTKGFVLADRESTALSIGDEPLQLYKKFDTVQVSVCEDRLTGIPRLLTECPDTEVILLDDAFQHRAVTPGLNILLVDYRKPYFKDYLLPMGNLRECRKGRKRADVIIVSKSPEDISPTQKELFIKKLDLQQHQHVFFSSITYSKSCIDFINGHEIPLEKQQQLILLTGIANNVNLLQYLQQQTHSVFEMAFGDHHTFTLKDIEALWQQYQTLPVGNKLVVTTEKDAMRLVPFKSFFQEHDIRIAYLPITISLGNEAAAFENLVRNYIKTHN